ncbi:hypothetical protein [Phaeacidiphilus oryzae]|uniref:hypothetical protein n=1 Tax=Phaeacidiphilus oryzae TaxID=348818 RepID=UPI000569ABB7|nr:hypothetical protein [Phaeacidiphilus oryzae]
MAQDVTISLWCDWCDLLGLERVPARHQHELALDGPVRRVDLCDRCHLQLEPFLELYKERGQQVEQPKKKALARKRPKPEPQLVSVPQQQQLGGMGAGAGVGASSGAELAGGGAQPGAQQQLGGQQELAAGDAAVPGGVPAAQAIQGDVFGGAQIVQPRVPQKKRGGRTRDPNKPSLVCPLAHPGSETGPMRISYEGRNSHADMVHGLRFSQIEWHDPDQILTVPCTVHQECLDHRVMFTTEVGARSHRASSNLPRLDED